jgi:ketosteroid isomerase-like protein
MSDIERNKATVRAFTDAVWRGRDYATIGEFFSPDFADLEIPGDPVAGLQAFFTGYFGRRPDFEVLGSDLTAEEDRVVQYIRGRFTNTEEKVGPLGPMNMNEINIFRLKDGKIVSRYGIGHSRAAH